MVATSSNPDHIAEVHRFLSMLLALEDRRYEVCVSWGALYRRVMMGVKNQLGGCDHVRDFLKGVTSYDSVLLQIYLFGDVGIIQTII